MGKTILSVYIKAGQFFQHKNGSIYKVLSVPTTDEDLLGNRNVLRTIGLIELTCPDTEIKYSLPEIKYLFFLDFIAQLYPIDSNYIAADKLIDPSKYWDEWLVAQSFSMMKKRPVTTLKKSFLSKNLFYNLPEWEKFYE